MAVKTREEYLRSLQQLRPQVYVAGEKIASVLDSPYFRTSLNHMGMSYDWANDPNYAGLMRHWSSLVDEEVSFWTHVRLSQEELAQMIKAIKTFSARYFCTMCMGIGLSTLWATTYEIDQARGTNYHQRLKAFYTELQRQDLRFALGIMDPKGDRSLSPSRQPDPDLHLRIIRRTSDGIVVRGAKMHTTNAPCTHLFFAAPCRALREEDADYAVAFVVPIDTKGLYLITRPAAGPLEPRPESPVSGEIGFVESLSVFDDVFVPWERVFMCGEWEFSERFIHYFSAYARLAKCVCLSARIDLLAGITALIAEYNGTERASHIRSKLTDMMIASNIGWGCALGAAAQAVQHPSGLPIPNIGISNAGVYHVRLRFVEFMGMLQEIAGGAVTTMPLAPDRTNPITGPWVDKYMQGKTGTSPEERIKVLQLIQDLTASRFTGYLLSSAVCAAGTPETNRVDVFRNYDLAEKIEVARRWSKI